VDLFSILLFLHVLGAIVAFGPGFAVPIAASMVAKEPQHAHFMARVNALTAKAIVTPVSITLAITGTGLILVRGWDTITADRRWLEVALTLYVIALVFALAYHARNGRRMVQLTAQPPTGGGPSPELRQTATRLRYGGYLLAALVTVITFLMVTKPF
jgi:uncharacterized membrane protein